MESVPEIEALLKSGKTVRDATLDELAVRLAGPRLDRQSLILAGLRRAIETGRLVAAPRGGFMAPRQIGTIVKHRLGDRMP